MTTWCFKLIKSSIIVVVDSNRIHPQALFPKLGDNVVFDCLSTSRTTWTFHNQTLPVNAGVVNSTSLVISSITLDNGGSYECMGTTEARETFYARAYLKVISECINSMCLINVALLIFWSTLFKLLKIPTYKIGMKSGYEQRAYV